MSEEILQEFRNETKSTDAEMYIVSVLKIWSLYHLGELNELRRDVAEMTEYAMAKGNQFSLFNVKSVGLSLIYIADDQIQLANEDLGQILAKCRTEKSPVQLFNLFGALTTIHSGLGRSKSAYGFATE